jgi:hypothetical protein
MLAVLDDDKAFRVLPGSSTGSESVATEFLDCLLVDSPTL